LPVPAGVITVDWEPSRRGQQFPGVEEQSLAVLVRHLAEHLADDGHPLLHLMRVDVE
jgi:hypothetical protein